MIKNGEVDKVDELELNGRVAKSVQVVDGKTVLTLDDGSKLTLDGTPTPLEYNDAELPRCALCSAPPGEYPLFSADNKTHLCVNCAALAVRTFLENGVPVPLGLPLNKLIRGEQHA